jgi:hypothetical protein
VDGENGGGGALKFSEGASGSATGADERPREGEGCSWCASKGDRREGLVEERGRGGGRRKESGAWHSGGRVGLAGNGPRPPGTGGAVLCEQGCPGGLISGPWPQCRAAAPAYRRAWAAQCRVQTDSK